MTAGEQVLPVLMLPDARHPLAIVTVLVLPSKDLTAPCQTQRVPTMRVPAQHVMQRGHNFVWMIPIASAKNLPMALYVRSTEYLMNVRAMEQ